MKLILERWNKFINEAIEEEKVKEIQSFFDENTFFSGAGAKYKPTITKDNVTLVGDYYLYGGEDSFDHLRDRHVDGPGAKPGSKFDKNVNFFEVIKSLISKPSTEHDTQQNKIKWLDVDSGKDVGFMNVKKAENKQELQGTEEKTFVEEFKNTGAIPTMQKRGAIITTEEGAVAAQKGMALDKLPVWTPESDSKAFMVERILVKSGKGAPTRNVSFIAGDIGEGKKTSDGKIVISAITAFPGGDLVDNEGKSISDRNDLKKHGYYFFAGK